MSEDYQGSIRNLDTTEFINVANDLKSAVTDFHEIKNNINQTTTDLLAVWQGEARNAFEVKYDLLHAKLDDMEEFLIDYYQALLDADNTYVDADEQVAVVLKVEE